jgi:hypothetical protein
MATLNPYRFIVDDPTGQVYGIPTWNWRAAPFGYATRRQLSELGLCPGGHKPAGQLLRARRNRPNDPLQAWLYRLDLAKPKPRRSPAQQASLAKANAARRTCPGCERDVGYVPPDALGGVCNDCYDRKNFDLMRSAA